jgi:hypothetical protein
MNNTQIAIETVNSLLALSINALVATQQYQVLIETARREGREISDGELAALRAENQALTDSVLASWNEALHSMSAC